MAIAAGKDIWWHGSQRGGVAEPGPSVIIAVGAHGGAAEQERCSRLSMLLLLTDLGQDWVQMHASSSSTRNATAAIDEWVNLLHN